MKKISIIAAFCILVFSARGQKQVWTFQQCLDTALQRNISVNQGRLTNEINKINLEQSKANRVPNLSAGANEGFSFGRSIDPGSTTLQYYNQQTASTSLSVNSAMTLFSGFQLNRTIEQDKLNIEAGKYDIEKLRNDVTLNIATAYLQLLFSYEILDATKSQAKATGIQVEQTQKMVNAGKLPESNLYTIRSQQATDNLAVVNAQGLMDLAKVNLLQLMEVPVIDSFEVAKPTSLEPAAQLLESNTDIYNKALSIKPEIASAAIKTNSALMEISINESPRWPKLTLSGNINSDYATANRLSANSTLRNPFFTQMWNNLGEGIGLNLAIPIFTNRQIKSNIEKAKVNALNTQLSEQNTKNVLRKSIEQAYTDLRTAINKYAATKEQLSSAELSYKNTEKKYNVGLSTAIDYLIEQNNFFQAKSNMIQSKYDYLFKSKILDFYQGKPINF